MYICPNCKSTYVIKYGLQPNTIQKFQCKDCNRVFNANCGTIFYNLRTSEKEVKEIVHMFLRGVPLSVISEVKEITEKTTRGLLSKAIIHFEKFEGYKINYDNYEPEVLEIDEIYIKLQGKKKFYAWLSYDPKNKVIIDFEIGTHDKKSLEKLFKRLSKFRNKVKLVLVDALTSYGDLVSKYLGKKRFKPNIGVLNKSQYCKKLGGFLTYGMFGKSRTTIEKLVRKYELGKKISTALIERMNRDFRTNSPYMKRRSPRIARLLVWVKNSFKGIRFFHNICKPHNSLSIKSSKNWIQEPITPIMGAGLLEKVCPLLMVLKTPIIN